MEKGEGGEKERWEGGGSEQGAETISGREGWRAYCSVAFMSPQTIAGMPSGTERSFTISVRCRLCF